MNTGKDRFPRKPSGDHRVGSGGLLGVIRSGQYDGIGSFEVFGGFPQGAEWQESAVSQGAPGIQQDQIQVAMQTEMLKAVIQDENIRAIPFHSELPGLPAILAYPDRNRLCPMGHEHRFVAEGQRCQGTCSCGWRLCSANMVSFVAPAEDGRFPAKAVQVSGEPQAERGLAGAPHHQIPHADHIGGQFAATLRSPTLIKAQTSGIERCAQRQQGTRGPGQGQRW